MTRWEWIKAVASPTGPSQATTRHVLLTLGTHMDLQGGNCIPSILNTLAPETGLGESTVREHLVMAEKEGWIRRQRRGRSYLYTPRIPPAASGEDDPGHRQEPAVSDAPGEEVTPPGASGIDDAGHRQEPALSTAAEIPPGAGAAPGASGGYRQEPAVYGGESVEGRTTSSLRSESNDSSLRSAADPVVELIRSAATKDPDWRYEHPTGGEVVGWWIDLRNGSRPPGPEISKQGAAAKRLAAKHPRGAIIRALIGMFQLFPHSQGEPFDLFDLERKFAKAHDGFERHPSVQKYIFRQKMGDP